MTPEGKIDVKLNADDNEVGKGPIVINISFKESIKNEN